MFWVVVQGQFSVLSLVEKFKPRVPNEKCLLFVSTLLRVRELKIATALRQKGWWVCLIYFENTPFRPADNFDQVFKVKNPRKALSLAKRIRPLVTHVFSGSIDELTLMFCQDKPSPIVLDLNDVFAPSLQNHNKERFDLTKRCLELADGFCARDLQVKYAQKYDGWKIPRDNLLFPEYCWSDNFLEHSAVSAECEEISVVSVGTFCLETKGFFDSAYLRLAEMLTEQEIHFHIYPHWMYRNNQEAYYTDFREFFALREKTEYLHLHESLPLPELSIALKNYDVGLVSGASVALGQKLQLTRNEYMKSCFSGRISDYLDAGLPVLVNKEVAFNVSLLKRLGMYVDLDKIHQPGFKDYLMKSVNHIRTNKIHCKARERFSLLSQSERLSEYYSRLINKNAVQIAARENYYFAQKIYAGLKRRIWNVTTFGAYGKLTQEANDLKLKLSKYQKISEFIDGAGKELPNQLRYNLKSDTQKEEAVQIAGMLNWPHLLDEVEANNGYFECFRLYYSYLLDGDEMSNAWKLLSQKNLDQLLRDGYRNFKRTLATNYFTFLVRKGDIQIANLEDILSDKSIKECKIFTSSQTDIDHNIIADNESYRYFTQLLWSYLETVDKNMIRDLVEEPAIGNPIKVIRHGKLISQDIANSILEYYSICETLDLNKCNRVLEVGGGYGRNAHLILSLNPNVKYFIVDIPPANYVSTRYISELFPNKKIFKARFFDDFEEYRHEILEADVVWLLPNQLDLLPENFFEFGLSISTLGEMTESQIAKYLDNFERIINGYLYIKQWHVSHNPFDKMKIDDIQKYRKKSWKKMYSRTVKSNSEFFESMHKV